MMLFVDPEVVPYQGCLRIKNREGKLTRTGLAVDPRLEDIRPAEDNFTVEKHLNPKNNREEWVIVPAEDTGLLVKPALVFYYVQHPRQRLQGKDTSPDCILTTGCYGAAVVALMRPGDILFFRNKQFFEKVTFVGDSLLIETGREGHVSRS